MIQRKIVVCVALSIALIGSIGGQDTNPFDLKWRSGNKPTPNTTTSPLPEKAPAKPAADTAVEPAPSDPARADSEIADPNVTLEPVVDTPQSVIPEGTTGIETTDTEPDTARNVVAIPPVTTEQEETGLNEAPLIKRQASSGVLLLLIAISMILVAWVVNTNRGFLGKVYRAAMNENYSELLLRQNRFASAQYLYYIVYISFFINAAIFLYLATRNWSVLAEFSTVSLISVILFVALIYFCRHTALFALAQVFPIKKELRQYSFNIVLYNILAGVALLPIVLLFAFGPDALSGVMIVIGISILAIMYTLRQFRGVVIGSHVIAANAFQFFVYLCAIEILPILVLLKLVHN